MYSGIIKIYYRKTVKVNQSRYSPGVAQSVPGVKVPRLRDNGKGWWQGC